MSTNVKKTANKSKTKYDKQRMRRKILHRIAYDRIIEVGFFIPAFYEVVESNGNSDHVGAAVYVIANDIIQHVIRMATKNKTKPWMLIDKVIRDFLSLPELQLRQTMTTLLQKIAEREQIEPAKALK